MGTRARVKIGKVFSLDRQKCVGCGICSEVCPSHAIVVEDDTKRSIKLRYRICVGCGLCQKACYHKAIRVNEIGTRPLEKNAQTNLTFNLVLCKNCKSPISTLAMCKKWQEASSKGEVLRQNMSELIHYCPRCRRRHCASSRVNSLRIGRPLLRDMMGAKIPSAKKETLSAGLKCARPDMPH